VEQHEGIHESSGKALRIIKSHGDGGGLPDLVPDYTAAGAESDAAAGRRSRQNLHFLRRRWCWLQGTIFPQIGDRDDRRLRPLAAFGMSGFETLAQVYREIAYPKLKNLRYTGNLVCHLFGGLHRRDHVVRGMIIPDDKRSQYVDNLLGGLAMHLAGPSFCGWGSTFSW